MVLVKKWVVLRGKKREPGGLVVVVVVLYGK